jgi:hypothetical protein
MAAKWGLSQGWCYKLHKHMSQDVIFQLANGLAFISWVLLLLFYKRPEVLRLLQGIPVAALCLLYAILVFQVLQPADFSAFSTLEGITGMLSLPGAALVGWIHYLAFDLMTGLYIAGQSARLGIPLLLVLPCLLCTLMLGPLGLLLFFLIRWYHTGHYFVPNQ